MYLVDAKTGLQVLSSVFDGFVDHGRYKITGLAPGTYKVFFYGCGIATNYASQWYQDRATERAADPVRVRPSHLTSGINAVMATGGSISGQVIARATGKPVHNECVEAYDNATQAFGFAQTDKTGHYTMRGLATGRYSLYFSRCFRKGPNVISFTRPGPVSVKAPHATTGIITRLAPGGNVSGTVSAGMPPKPQIGTCVELAPLDPNGTYGFGQTGTDGTYTATGLAAGKYQVYFNDPFCLFGVPSLASQWYSGQQTQATADVVTVTTGGTTTGIDATLQPFGTITGAVTGPGHAAVSGECVTAVPIGKDFAGFFPPEIAINTATGSYSLLEVQPGRYKLKFSTGCGDSGFKTQWWQNATSRATATVITVGADAAVTGIDAVLAR
ncbi:MAG: carboxypeptidase regulatory-like domain-containing protein [Streptosporangiaceae bacterium]